MSPRHAFSRRSLLGAAALALTGCAPTPAPLGEQLTQRWAARDEPGFTALFAPQLRTRAQVIFANLSQLRDVTVTPTPGRLTVTWRAAPAERPTRHELIIDEGHEGGTAMIAAVNDGPAGSAVWTRYPIEVSAGARCDVVAAASRMEESATWAQAADQAAHRLGEAGLGAATSGWSGRLTLELPHDVLEFSRINGRAEIGTVAAYTYATGVSDAAHIVVQPGQEHLDEASRVGLLTHEGVHVVTRSMYSPAPLWVAEGLAESVATRQWPEQTARNAGHVRGAGLQTGLPSEADLRDADPARASTAYALAEVAVEAMMARWGRDQVLRWVVNWAAAPGDDELIAAYVAALPA